jgi:DNA-directed RNA polymerase subunit K/omega
LLRDPWRLYLSALRFQRARPPEGVSAQLARAGPIGTSMELTLPQRLQKAVSGSFHKTALLQKRVRELIRGAAPLIETRERNPIKIAFLEMERGLIELIPDEEPPPAAPPA